MHGDPEPEWEDIGDDHEYAWEDLHRDRDHEPPPVIVVSDEGMSPLSDQPHLLGSSETPGKGSRSSDYLNPEELAEARTDYLRLKRLRKVAKGLGVFTAIDLRNQKLEAPTPAARQGEEPPTASLGLPDTPEPQGSGGPDLPGAAYSMACGVNATRSEGTSGARTSVSGAADCPDTIGVNVVVMATMNAASP